MNGIWSKRKVIRLRKVEFSLWFYFDKNRLFIYFFLVEDKIVFREGELC